MTAADLDRVRLAYRLELAIDKMAGRYGVACMERGLAMYGTDKHAAAERRADRRYTALLRLTAALAGVAAGGVR